MIKHTIGIKLNDTSYEILIGDSALAELGRELKKRINCSHAVVITNPNVRELCWGIVKDSLEGSAVRCDLIEVPDGEEYKSLEVAVDIYKKLISLKTYRFNPIIALGGGVIGDLAGFVAATYMRGVPFVQVPTTLLAQVDSSIGGKVGVNLPEGKNLVGCFYQPKLVFIEIGVLMGLQDIQFISGMAEVVKYGFIMDAEFLSYVENHLDELLQRTPDVLVEIVKRSCQIKARVVEMDEKDRGIRSVLNYGHTIGHALESLSGYRKYYHGEAISIGMVGASIIASKLGMISNKDVKRHKELLSRIGLPISLEGLSTDEIILQMERDKKFMNAGNRFVLLEGIGKAKILSRVSWDVIKDTLNALGAN